MESILELTHFVGDRLNCDMDNLDLLMDLIDSGEIAPASGKTGAPDAACFVEPSLNAVDSLGLSGYGLGFSLEFLKKHGLLETVALETVPVGPEPALRTWEPIAPVRFAVEDIQTLYVQQAESVPTLRIVYPRYAGTFVIFDQD